MPLLIIPLAAVDIVFTALFGIAIIVAAVLLGRWLGEGLRQVPLIGGAVAGAIESVAAAASNAVLPYVNATVNDGLDLLRLPSRIIAPAFRTTADALEHTFNSIVWVATAFVPSQIASLHGYIDAIAFNIETYLNQTVIPFYDRVIGAVQTDVRQLFGIAQSQQGQIDATNSQVQTKANASDLAGISQTIGNVQSQVRQAYDDLASQQGQITATAGAVAAIPGYVDTTVRQGVDTSKGYADQAVGTYAASIAGVLAYTLSEATTFENFWNDCGQSVCDDLGKVVKDVNGILKIVEIGALLAFLGAAVSDPVATANDTVDVIDPFVNAGASLVTELVGAAGGLFDHGG